MLGEDSVDRYGRSALWKLAAANDKNKENGSGSDDGYERYDVDAAIKARLAGDTIERKKVKLKETENRQEVGKGWRVVDIKVPCDGADDLISGVRNFQHSFVQVLE